MQKIIFLLRTTRKKTEISCDTENSTITEFLPFWAFIERQKPRHKRRLRIDFQKVSNDCFETESALLSYLFYIETYFERNFPQRRNSAEITQENTITREIRSRKRLKDLVNSFLIETEVTRSLRFHIKFHEKIERNARNKTLNWDIERFCNEPFSYQQKLLLLRGFTEHIICSELSTQ